MKGIFQVDSLSVLIYILWVDPVSFFLHKLQGYACAKHENYNVTYNFFVDDLKLYPSSTNIVKKATRSSNTGMTFGMINVLISKYKTKKFYNAHITLK